MNSTITFTDKGLFLLAVTTLELESTPEYAVDFDNMTIITEDAYSIAAILRDNGIFNFHWSGADEFNDDRMYPSEPDQFRTDAEADADALASAGMGTDEDYHLDVISGEEY
jgi:hypothetical protein